MVRCWSGCKYFLKGTPNILYDRSFSSDDMFKGSSHLADNLLNPATAMSEEPDETPLNTSFGSKANIFEWLEGEGNDDRRRRFGMAMVAAQFVIPSDLITQGIVKIICTEYLPVYELDC